MSFIGTSYKWGGAHPADGLDCSGFSQIIRAAFGVDIKGDQNAQNFYDLDVATGLVIPPRIGAFCYYGMSNKQIIHIAPMINSYLIVEAGGGGSKTTDSAAAIRDEAFIRIRPYNYRKDLISVMMPNYPKEVLSG